MKHVVAIASGKGGVGKSTVAVNLAVALANMPRTPGESPKRVALIDVDFYGPSVPTLMGGGQIQPDHENRILPAEKYGVKYISLAFFLKNRDDAVIWRGPMLGKGMNQLFHDVNWGEVDVCLVDMPPGTGDAQISLSQMVNLAGVIMVTTPQEVALSDVRRAINMFRRVNVDVLGIVENMSAFITPAGERIELFGTGGGASLAEEYRIPLLASIPLDIKVREGGDEGHPIALEPETTVGAIYVKLAQDVVSLLEARAQAPLRIVN